MNAPTQERAAELDVAGLPSYAFSHHSLMWWGNAGLMLIEGTVFALCVMMYFYLASHASSWPMSVPPPNLSWGTLNTVILLVSLLPNFWVKRATEQQNLGQVRIAITICLAFALAFLVVRIWEFKSLNCRWDTNAYGSIIWLLLALHTVHLLTDALDTTVLTVLMFTGPLEGKRFVDVSENAVYWDFVVLSWLPIYGVLYWAPRLINGGGY
jgi:cytochrome c oxidase subunit III